MQDNTKHQCRYCKDTVVPCTECKQIVENDHSNVAPIIFDGDEVIITVRFDCHIT